MNIVVLLKQTLDTEEKIQIEDNKISENNVKFVINPYDEYAVEEAVKIKEEHGGEITVVSLGPSRADNALRTALAMGADKAVLIDSDSFGFEIDEYSASVILTAAVKKQPFDIILCGNMAVDGGSSQVGPRVAELLDIAQITTITKLQLDGQKVTVERDVEGDTETIETSVPVLLTTQQGLNEPRYPSLPGIMKAKKKPFDNVFAADLGIDPASLRPKTGISGLTLPPKREAGRILSGTTGEQVSELVRTLRNEAKVV
jgi:electron transfer flavoprotein beta subunit